MTNRAHTKGQRTREAIISTAHTLFVEQGYHGTSMRQIALETGLALASIYNHFSGKEELFTAVFERYHPYLEILPALKGAPTETIEQFVVEAARRLVEALEKRPGFLNLIFIELVEFEGEQMPAIFDSVLPDLEVIIQRFQAASSAFRPIPIPILLRAFIGLFFSYVITEMTMGALDIPGFEENAFNSLVDIYLHGVLAKG
jgi:AcrR family transcriptional regulator